MEAAKVTVIKVAIVTVIQAAIVTAIEAAIVTASEAAVATFIEVWTARASATEATIVTVIAGTNVTSHIVITVVP
jgi:hypothetical protein